MIEIEGLVAYTQNVQEQLKPRKDALLVFGEISVAFAFRLRNSAEKVRRQGMVI